MKSFLFWCLPFLSSGLFAQPVRCSYDDSMEILFNVGDIFFGEIHGTNEVSEFIQCFVQHTLAASDEKVVVSLEMESSVINSESKFWTDAIYSDGRSSQAMFRLVRYLVEKQESGLLSLHFQHPVDPERAGRELNNLASEARVIALAGNVHSSKSLSPGRRGDLTTEGMFVGDSFTHVMLASAGSGEIWACMGACGIQKIEAQPNPESIQGTLKDGSNYGHDYIYFLNIEKFTASPPMATGL